VLLVGCDGSTSPASSRLACARNPSARDPPHFPDRLLVLWLILLFLCWPLALLALVLYPFVWLLLLPFRLVGIAVDGVFDLLRAIIMLPARVVTGRRRA